MKKILLSLSLTLCLLLPKAQSQPAVMPWGNIRGFHVDGEKMNFETSVRSVKPGWNGCVASERCNWEGTHKYEFSEKTTVMSHLLQALPVNYAVKVSETGLNSVNVEVTVEVTNELKQEGTFFCFEVPGSEFVNATLGIYSGQKNKETITLKKSVPAGKSEYTRATGNRIVLKSGTREYEVTAGKNTEIIVKQNFIDRPGFLNDPLPAKEFVDSYPGQPVADYQVYFTMIPGNAKKGNKITGNYAIVVNGSVDSEEVTLKIDTSQPGRRFKGIGSNYRVHDLEKEGEVIDYCLDSLRVTWGRIAFDWNQWQPDENIDPRINAKAGKLSKAFYDQIEMARILAKRGIPAVVTIWSPPSWAVDSLRNNRQGLEHDAKISLNPKKIETICKSIADYFEFLKTDYGLEFPLFSFNEVDYGVMVYHTPEEHAFYTKEIGKYFASRGLITKILLGDTGAGTIRSNKIIIPAVEDKSIHKYIGAVAFHTWHGCTEADCKAWLLSAQKINVPLLVTEGGPNSAQHRYPQNFLERSFQLSEIDLYLRVCKYAQPASILEWQLTPDYSVLTGNGLYGDYGPLRPTQRFWNLKQLGSTPENSFHVPLTIDRPNITAAAFADILNGKYTIHLVNNSATRTVHIEGFPVSVKSFDLFVTDINRGMQKVKTIKVNRGKATFTADSQAYYSLFTSDGELQKLVSSKEPTNPFR